MKDVLTDTRENDGNFVFVVQFEFFDYFANVATVVDVFINREEEFVNLSQFCFTDFQSWARSTLLVLVINHNFRGSYIFFRDNRCDTLLE